MSDPVLHLERMHHDVVAQTTEIWCDASWMSQGNVTDDVDRCTCLDCLDKARGFGRRCEKRRLAVLRSPQ